VLGLIHEAACGVEEERCGVAGEVQRGVEEAQVNRPEFSGDSVV
jgi:hypothetical protein